MSRLCSLNSNCFSPHWIGIFFSLFKRKCNTYTFSVHCHRQFCFFFLLLLLRLLLSSSSSPFTISIVSQMNIVLIIIKTTGICSALEIIRIVGIFRTTTVTVASRFYLNFSWPFPYLFLYAFDSQQTSNLYWNT